MLERMRIVNLLVALLLAGCATSGPTVQLRADASAGGLPTETLCQEEDGCLTLVCGEAECAFYPCEEVARYASTVVQVRGTGPVNVSPAWRFWGTPQGLPKSLESVFVIPWKHHHRRELLPSQKKLLAEWEERLRRPHEKHHIFPQEFKKWFDSKSIPIHRYTVLVDKELHDRIHKGVSGGPWNAAWRAFQKVNPGASPDEIWTYAWELCVKFGIYGPILPYHRRFEPLPPVIDF